MKSNSLPVFIHGANVKHYCIMLAIIIIAFTGRVSVAAGQSNYLQKDTSVKSELNQQLNNSVLTAELIFPLTVKRFYAKINNEPVWTKQVADNRKTWDAILLLNCVRQYGLSYTDYHPKEIAKAQSQQLLDKLSGVSNAEKMRFEIMLTDALIAFINNVHYGKLNPDFSSSRVDAAQGGDLRADEVLLQAVKSNDLANAIISVQPTIPQYCLLQDQLRLITNQYTGDCYEIPESTARKVAINMERLRWAGNNGVAYLQVNIPAYTLKFYQADTTYLFKVIVGKPDHRTPTLQSKVQYFTTAPEWHVPARIFQKVILPKALKNAYYLEGNHLTIYNKANEYIVPDAAGLAMVKQNTNDYVARQSSGCDNALGNIVFRFPNVYNVYLHDTPQQQLFSRAERAFSHGCVRVEHAGKLAELLLSHDGAASRIPALRKTLAAYQTQRFTLKKPVPVIITYLTCEVKNGELCTYDDIYKLDNQLEMALYGADQQFTMSNQ